MSALTQPTADVLAARCFTDGGFTFDPRARQYVTQGFAVSPYPDRSKVVPIESLSGFDVRNYADANSDLLAQPGHMLGGWLDDATGDVWLDVSVVVDYLIDATMMAHQNGQLAVYDITHGEEFRLDPPAPNHGNHGDVVGCHLGWDTNGF